MLKNKVSLITGCNRGIGYSILKKFAENKSDIIACFRKKNKQNIKITNELKKKYKIKIVPLYFDLSDANSLEKKILSVVNKYKIDVLVNNAGILKSSLFQMTKIESIKEMFEINFFSQLSITQLVLKSMVAKKKGSIINISSTSGLDSNLGRISYASSKSSLITATKVISKEVGFYNVRVNAIAPGISDTDMFNLGHSEKIKKSILETISLKRISSPEEIANVALFLASDLSSYITGQVVRVDGGMQN